MVNLHSTWLGKFSGKTKNFQPYGQKNCEEIFSCYLITTQQFFLSLLFWHCYDTIDLYQFVDNI